MERHSTYLIVVLLIILFYGWNVYDQFFTYEPGYIYDSKNNDLYEVEYQPRPGTYHDRWKYLLPFVRPKHNLIVEVFYKGKLTQVIADSRRIPSPDYVLDETNKIGGGFTFLFADYWVRGDIDVMGLILSLIETATAKRTFPLREYSPLSCRRSPTGFRIEFSVRSIMMP